MKTLKALTVLSMTLGLSQVAQAISTSCNLLNTPIPQNVRMSEQEVIEYKNKLTKECSLQQDFKSVQDRMKNKFDLSLEEIAEYQAMRYVVRKDYEIAKMQGLPVQKIYQIHNSQYLLPYDQRSTIIWDNWIRGIEQLETAREKFTQGSPFTIADLKYAHMNFYKLSDEQGDAANDPSTGIFKPESPEDNYWWSFNDENEANQAKTIVANINKSFSDMGIPVKTGNSTIDNILDVRMAIKKNSPNQEFVYAIYSGNSQVNQKNIENILTFMNKMFDQARGNNHMMWRGKLMSPMELAYFVQKFYVAVHPFNDGNGRTSRFLAELLLTSFELPHGSMGDLMGDDVLVTNEDYYNRAVAANSKLLEKVSACGKEYKAFTNIFVKKAKDIVPQNLSYDCQILKN